MYAGGLDCGSPSYAEVDNAIGDITSSLESNGLAEDTLIVMTADNGPADLVSHSWSTSFCPSLPPLLTPSSRNRDLWTVMISAVQVLSWVAGRKLRMEVVAAARGKGVYVLGHTLHFSSHGRTQCVCPCSTEWEGGHHVVGP